MGYQPTGLIRLLYYLQSLLSFLYCIIQIQTSENTNNKDKEAGGVDLRLESCQLRAGMGPSCSWKYSSNSPVGFTPYFIYGILLCLPLRSNSITNNLIGRSQFYCPYALVAPQSNSIYRFSFDLNFCSSVDTNFDRLLIN